MEKWVLEAKRADFQGLGRRFGVDPLIIRLMVNRGVCTEAEMERYLYGTLEDLNSPGLMKDMEKAAFAVLRTIKAGLPIVIASDFDVDGIFSGQILWEGLRRLGASAGVKTPHRVKEGYGLNQRIVEEAAAEGAGLLLTCDNGIAAFEAAERAAELGIPLVVTDHHEVAFRKEADGSRTYLLPKAEAILDPKQEDCPYPFKKLCGAGVAYKLIQYLYEKQGIPDKDLKALLEYVAIATVADVMDLEGENRILVKEGLKRLRRTEKPGLKALIDANQLAKDRLSAYHIGFVLGPCFNAAGRLETAAEAFALLTAQTLEEAEPLARQLKALNDSRKEMTVKGTERAIEAIENSSLKNDKVMVVSLENCHESLVGIIAGRIKERYHRPVIVVTQVEEGVKGSGRSIEAYNMFEGLQACRHLMSRFGGHAMAAGLTLPKENLPILREQLNREANLTEEDFVPIIKIDAAMPLGYISEKLVEELELLEPFGKGNPKPLFAEKQFWLRRISLVGKTRPIVKLQVQNAVGTVLDAIYFGDAEEFERQVTDKFGRSAWEQALQGRKNEICLMLAYYPSINEYMGRRNLQIVVENYCC